MIVGNSSTGSGKSLKILHRNNKEKRKLMKYNEK